jgi:hypothetical protein
VTSLIGAGGFLMLIVIVMVLLRDLEPHNEDSEDAYQANLTSAQPSAQAGD